jgi:hypothetical protein
MAVILLCRFARPHSSTGSWSPARQYRFQARSLTDGERFTVSYREIDRIADPAVAHEALRHRRVYDCGNDTSVDLAVVAPVLFTAYKNGIQRTVIGENKVQSPCYRVSVENAP